MSDLTRRIQDEEQQELAFEAHRMATLLITRHRDRLEVFAAELLAHEVLERGDIDRIMDGVAKVDHRRVPPPSAAGRGHEPQRSPLSAPRRFG